MNLTALRTFLAIIEAGSLVRASTQLNVTQSTVTARLKSLEDEVGQTLINRQKSGISLTAAGVRLRRYAETISELWLQARQETALPHGVSSLCNIACHPDLWVQAGKKLFSHIRETEPAVALSAWLGNQGDISAWLASGLSDISLTYWPTAHGSQTIYPLMTDQLILVSTRADSPTKFDPGYVFVEAGEEFGRAHAAAYSNADTARLSFGTAQLGLEHILEHGGSAYLPDWLVTPHLAVKQLHKLDDAPVFERKSFVVVNERAAQGWPWLADSIGHIQIA
ncbi:MAG: LysR family transcriptional regulator [Hyphomicrobiales bacterium]